MDTLDTRVQIFAIVGSALLFVFVLELLRRRRLSEPYAILWLLASVVLLVLSVWDDLLDSLAEASSGEVDLTAMPLRRIIAQPVLKERSARHVSFRCT